MVNGELTSVTVLLSTTGAAQHIEQIKDLSDLRGILMKLYGIILPREFQL
jgi:hypothetical protein